MVLLDDLDSSTIAIPFLFSFLPSFLLFLPLFSRYFRILGRRAQRKSGSSGINARTYYQLYRKFREPIHRKWARGKSKNE